MNAHLNEGILVSSLHLRAARRLRRQNEQTWNMLRTEHVQEVHCLMCFRSRYFRDKQSCEGGCCGHSRGLELRCKEWVYTWKTQHPTLLDCSVWGQEEFKPTISHDFPLAQNEGSNHFESSYKDIIYPRGTIIDWCLFIGLFLCLVGWGTGESQGWESLVSCCLWGHTELDTTEAT